MRCSTELTFSKWLIVLGPPNANARTKPYSSPWLRRPDFLVHVETYWMRKSFGRRCLFGHQENGGDE